MYKILDEEGNVFSEYQYADENEYEKWLLLILI